MELIGTADRAIAHDAGLRLEPEAQVVPFRLSSLLPQAVRLLTNLVFNGVHRRLLAQVYAA